LVACLLGGGKERGVGQVKKDDATERDHDEEKDWLFVGLIARPGP